LTAPAALEKKSGFVAVPVRSRQTTETHKIANMFTLTPDQESFLLARFKKNYPDFESFSKPGSLGTQELNSTGSAESTSSRRFTNASRTAHTFPSLFSSVTMTY